MATVEQQTSNRKKRLGELLVEAGVLQSDQLDFALRKQKIEGGKLGALLVRLGYISERNLVIFLKKHLNLPGVDLKRFTFDPHMTKYIDKQIAKRFTVLPLAMKHNKAGKQVLFVAMSDPTNLEALDQLRFATNMLIQPVVAADGQLVDAIGLYYDGITSHADSDYHDEIKLDDTDSGPMVIFQGGDSMVVGDKPPEPVEGGGSREYSDEDLPGTPNLRMKDVRGNPTKAVLALAQILIDQGIITRQQMLDQMKKLRGQS